MTDYTNQIVETKKGYSLTTDETPNENISITDFLPEKKKKITVNLNNGGANNVYRSSYFDETITINNGDYDLMLYGNSSKNTVPLPMLVINLSVRSTPPEVVKDICPPAAA